MGKYLSKLMRKLSSDGPKRILMLGLDNAGKTTILYRMKRTEDFHTVPTIGFNVETISPYRGISLTVWDVGGQDHLRSLWHHYFENVDGLVFVVDSTDHRRLSVARAELEGIFSYDSMKSVPLVIFANKQDDEGALSPDEIAEKLNLLSKSEISYFVAPCCALTGEGLTDAFTTLVQMIRFRQRSIQLNRL